MNRLLENSEISNAASLLVGVEIIANRQENYKTLNGDFSVIPWLVITYTLETEN